MLYTLGGPQTVPNPTPALERPLGLLNGQQLRTQILQHLLQRPELDPQDPLRLRTIPVVRLLHRGRDGAHAGRTDRRPFSQLREVRTQDIRDRLARDLACADYEALITGFGSKDRSYVGCCDFLQAYQQATKTRDAKYSIPLDQRRCTARPAVAVRLCCY